MDNYKKYKCGHCGKDKYELYHKEGENLSVYAKCLNCGSMTEITFTSPELFINTTNHCEGIMILE